MRDTTDPLPIFRPNYGEEELEAVAEVFKSGWIGAGPRTDEFGRRFASYVGSKHGIPLNSATAALHLSLIVAGIKRGDEVIIPALTFVSTAHVVSYLGATPVFADVEPDTLCLSPEDTEKRITKKTRAIIPIHYGGHPSDMDKLESLASSHNIPIIEDAAHACGSSYKNRKIGSLSALTCFSFHAVKNIAVGDGGMITTNDHRVADRLRKLCWLGINKNTWGRIEKEPESNEDLVNGYHWSYGVDELGYKYHMNDISAALGLVQLEKVEKGNQKRRDLARKYTAELSQLDSIDCPVVRPNVITSQHNYAIRCNKRDELHVYLRDQKISTGVHYLPLYKHSYYKRFSPDPNLLVTEKEWQRLLLLPLYPQMTEDEQSYVIGKVQTFYS